MVSVIIPTKNRCPLLKEAVNSLLNQTHRDWEAIIVDDGSSDDTLDYLGSVALNEPRIKFFKRKNKHAGASVCRNEGIDASNGEYIIFLDSDNCLSPSCIENRLQAVSDDGPLLDFAVFPCEVFQNIPGDLSILWNVDKKASDIDRFLGFDNPWQTGGVFWRHESVAKIGMWDESLLSWQDKELHLRALIKGLSFKRFPGPDCYWRRPKEESIGLHSASKDHLSSHEAFVDNTHSLLSEANLLNQNRRLLLAGIYFWIARNWVQKDENIKAVKLWAHCHDKGLIDERKYREGCFYFGLKKETLSEWVVRRCTKIFWQEQVTRNYSNTFRRIPVSKGVKYKGN